METLKIELSVKELTELTKEIISKSVIQAMSANKDQIEKSLDQYFKKSFFDNKLSNFENALDWAVENSFRIGLEQAMEELNFKELIASKAKELLSNETFLRDLAEAKVRSSLGLPSK